MSKKKYYLKFSNLRAVFKVKMKFKKKNPYYQEVPIHLVLLNEDLDYYVFHHLKNKNLEVQN